MPEGRLGHGLPHVTDGGNAEEGRGREVCKDAAEELILGEDALLECHGGACVGDHGLGGGFFLVITIFHYFSLKLVEIVEIKSKDDSCVYITLSDIPQTAPLAPLRLRRAGPAGEMKATT